MKLLIASDIHGIASAAKKLLNQVDSIRPDKIILLGDILNNGPRNGVPKGYDPKATIELLNPYAKDIICVRGNCDSEVDEMVLNFPLLADYNYLYDASCGTTLFLTHGHVWGPGIHNSVNRLPELPDHSYVLYGHTHKKVNEVLDREHDIRAFNPGSISLPKDGTCSYAMYEDGKLEHRLLD